MTSSVFFAIQCGNCNEVLISRAHYDCNFCTCFKNGVEGKGIFIDGNSRVDSNGDSVGYIRGGGVAAHSYHVTLPIDSTEAYQDWNKGINKWKTIDLSKYPHKEIIRKPHED